MKIREHDLACGTGYRRTDSRTDGRQLSLQILLIVVPRKDRTTSLTLCSTVVHDEPYVMQYDYA